MNIRSVKVSEKGQIAIPVDVREAIGLRKGDELLLIQEGDKILLEKTMAVKGALRAEFDQLLAASERTAKKLWDNKYDEVWNDV